MTAPQTPLMRLACWLVGIGAYLAAKDHVRAQLAAWSFGDLGRTVLVAYADWNAAMQADRANAVRAMKPNKRRAS